MFLCYSSDFSDDDSCGDDRGNCGIDCEVYVEVFFFTHKTFSINFDIFQKKSGLFV